MRKLGLPEPPRAHAPPHVLFDSQHYSTLSYSSLGSYFSFLFFTFLRQFNLTYLQLKSAPRKRHWLVLTYKNNCLSFYLDETHASEMNWIRSGPPSECTKRPILGKDISEKTHMSLTFIPCSEANGCCFRESSLDGSHSCSSLHMSPRSIPSSEANCWCFRKGFLEGSPNCSSLHRFPSFIPSSAANGWCFRKGFLEGSPNCSSLHKFPSFIPSSAANGWCFRKAFLEGSPNCSSLHKFPSFIPSSAANGWCFRKGFLEGSPNCSSLHMFPSLVSYHLLPQMACASEMVLWRVPPTVLLYICPVSHHLLRQIAVAAERVL